MADPKVDPSVCRHPFDSIRFDVGRTGQRGQASVYHAVCLSCSQRFPGAAGIKCLVESLQVDNQDIWRALRDAGFSRDERPQPTPARRDQPTGECVHFLSWVRVESTGLASRGHSGMVWFRCAGCKSKWNMAAGLKVFLDRVREDQLQIKAAIRKLGVEIR